MGEAGTVAPNAGGYGMLQAVLTFTQAAATPAGLPALAWLSRSRDLLAGGFSGQ